MPRWLDAGRHHGSAWDRRWALALHRTSAHPALRAALLAATRLGDAPMWLALTVLMPLLAGRPGWQVSLQMLQLGVLNLAIYWTLKHATRRVRPCQGCDGITACAPPADRFSFPSGHTLHAVAFAVLLSGHFPGLWPVLAAFAAVVAVSRIVLGLHYPSDVLAGAAIGLATGGGVLLAA